MTDAQRQRCEAAGIPADDIERIDEAVSHFDDLVIRDRAVDDLIAAWKKDRR